MRLKVLLQRPMLLIIDALLTGTVATMIFLPALAHGRSRANLLVTAQEGMPSALESSARAPQMEMKRDFADAIPRTTLEREAPSPSTTSAKRDIPPKAKVYLDPNAFYCSTYIPGTGTRERIKKMIEKGVVVKGKRVRLELLPHTYRQPFPMPTKTALNVTAALEHSCVISTGARTHLQVGLQAIKAEMPQRPMLIW